MSQGKKPLVLMILDGWGYREAAPDNAIATANTPVMDELWENYPHSLVDGSGDAVGLPKGQMGNSEVGHVNLGAGRIVFQDFTRISKSIQDGEFFNNPVLCDSVQAAVDKDGAVHIMGLLSPGGVHSHEDHIVAMVELAAQKGAKNIYLHAFLDGRDTPPRSAKPSIERFEALFERLGVGRFASLSGRFYAMDRDNRWERIEQAYNAIYHGRGQHSAVNALEALDAAYERGQSDEFVAPVTIGQPVSIAANDAVVFMNFRADRAREMTRAFTDSELDTFERGTQQPLSAFVMLTQYADDLDAACAFPPEPLNNVFGEWLAKQGKTQLRISETEKYAHVTFFFSGGREQEFDGEKRVLIPSPQVKTYDLQPEMSSEQLTDELIAAIESGEFDAIICNYPNGDMVGHTGDFEAAVKACEAVDHSVGRVIKALQAIGGEALITADHGNAEQMSDASTGQAHTAHTSELVPFIYVGRDASPRNGILSDVAPTMLHLMGLEQPHEMTGKTLMTLKTK
ncbi:MAG: phosphoglycerate mutase (2,3-diphosphoglycerate-independent) [Idiomarina sp.]|uniref:2,3-bisphosphoglycerate-independent phosphoglycerate mutase n=1 Tax=Idiomarina aquatica TaxID=1327752 RepID=A0A4R6NXU2_9GAMM|nr:MULTISPECIES: 2,3-bisphosphoglycerate-independent phosphoglycerate mutase [Idiomarina]MBL4741371.1 2,3-bisphosphoglycerate-independent phosphoglycerate mutase [Idiomarina sp.]MBT41532.1 phosphoglycerate mutase (2,3-diphosphoglycerate-independent) [Idiomarina sp.]PHQ77993.1 MAG: phosphoglycerate mutase (2,3-diphosphoglycerate-independent) [Idiomarina sp.]TDP29036.1 phosphoglycerate mutase [Idiomarina aquatica]